MSRPDISPYLIHFTSGTDMEDAFSRIKKIVAEKTLIAGSKCIKGSYKCVCFSEAPLTSLTGGLVNTEHYSRYSPFGILISKQWLHDKGGRPVIYQPDSEYSGLAESHRWRHHRYEPRASGYQVDFTWEREWRIRCDHLEFDHTCAKIIVPDQSWANKLISEHDREQHFEVMQYALIFDDVLAESYRESFGWKIGTLN